MKKRPIQWNIKQINKMINQTGSMRLDHPLQRSAGQWKKDAPSLLIDSIFTMFVPHFIVLQKPNPEYDEETNPKVPKFIYWVIDGVQRSTYFTTFIDPENGWTLDKNLNKEENDDGELIEISVPLDDGQEEFLAGKKFTDLSDDAQEKILSYSLSFQIVELENGDDEEKIVKKIFDRINAGEKVSKSHHAFIAADAETKIFVSDQVDNHPLMTDVGHFTATDIKGSKMELSVLQNIILASGVYWEDFSDDSIKKVVSKNKFSKENMIKVKKAYDMIATIEPKKSTFLSRINIVSFANLLIHNEFDANVLAFITHYESIAKAHDEYKMYQKSATNKKSSIQGRTIGLQNMYEKFLKTHKQTV